MQKIKIFLSLLFCIFILNCSKTDPATGEKILIEPDTQKKAREFADKGGGIFGDINNYNPCWGYNFYQYAYNKRLPIINKIIKVWTGR